MPSHLFKPLRSRGLIAYWPTREGTGTTAGDLLGGYDGSFSGGMSWATQNGQSVVEADGVNGYVSIPSMATPMSTDSYTVMGWWYHQTLTDSPVMFGSNSWTGMLLHTDSTGVVYAGTNSSLRIITSAGYLSTATWYHIAVTLDDGVGHKLYKNGSQTHSNANHPASTWSTAHIGGIAALNWFDGYAKDVGVWDRALTADEVNYHYRSRDWV